MQILRTPDDRFDDVPDFPYAPRYCEISDGEGGALRVAWVEDGPKDADPLLMLHGEPSWSYLYRKMIPVAERVYADHLRSLGKGNHRCLSRPAVSLNSAARTR